MNTMRIIITKIIFISLENFLKNLAFFTIFPSSLVILQNEYLFHSIFKWNFHIIAIITVRTDMVCIFVYYEILF